MTRCSSSRQQSDAFHERILKGLRYRDARPRRFGHQLASAWSIVLYCYNWDAVNGSAQLQQVLASASRIPFQPHITPMHQDGPANSAQRWQHAGKQEHC
jgi:hypothetical protein